MLKHLIAKTAPIAMKENIVRFNEFRITVLGECLFRVERDPSGNFNDNATQHVWFRNAPIQQFRVSKAEDSVTLTTACASLTVCDDPAKSYVTLNGKTLPLENAENLLGTTRTLDRYDGETHILNGFPVELEPGVCSKNGVAVIDDTDTLCLTADGKPAPRGKDLTDIYVFAYGKNYRDAVRALYTITGCVPMLPRFAFGNWWSRYYAYSDEEYLHLMDEFARRGAPLTVATLDMDWHYSANLDEEKQITAQGKNTEDRACNQTPDRPRVGWTGYSWNKNLFPDYRSFLDQLRKRDLKITLNLHPSDGIRYYEDMYPEMARAMGIDPATEQAVKFDISNDDFIKAYFEILHHPYEKDGVDFWWIDWQQGTTSEMEGLDPLWALNHYHFLDNERDGKHALIMSRYAGIGSHRYPIGFSGDTTISWKTLELMPYFTATAANCGYTWWGHDIGGHHLGTKDDELYLRFLQFGVFNPINRMHSTSSPLITKEPWAYENGIGELAIDMLRLRHRMIPFLYTCNYRTHAEGLALCEPLYYEYPDAPESYAPEFRNEYLFGQSFIVAPITRHSEEKGLTSMRVWLPEGTWTDFFTGDIYRVGKGGKVFTAVRPLNSIPVFAKEGAVMVLSNDTGNSTKNPSHLEARIYNGNGTFTLYEDTETDTAAAFTRFESTAPDANTQKVTVSCTGERTVIPADRTVTLVFPNIVVHHPADLAAKVKHAPATVTVLKNGAATACEIDSYAEVRVSIPNFDPQATYEVTVSSEAITHSEEVKRAIVDKLQKTQAPYCIRTNLLDRIAKRQDIKALAGMVLLSDLAPIDKQHLIEAAF